MINIRQKGAEGEREICRMLNPIVQKVMIRLNFPEEQILSSEYTIQRNQNQSAVGGCDLTNTFGLAIEIKRQEQLQINTWWKQCEESAARNQEHPVLLYRQNGKKWRCVTRAWLPLPGSAMQEGRVEFDLGTFLKWFESLVYYKLMNGAEVRT